MAPARRLDLTLLRLACFITVLVGVMSAMAAHPLTEAPWRWLFDLLDWPLDGHPGSFDPQGQALNAVLGGVMVGWGVLMERLVAAALRGTPLPRREMLIGLVAWFAVDSTGSIVAGLYGNVVLNVGFAMMFGVPLALPRWVGGR